MGQQHKNLVGIWSRIIGRKEFCLLMMMLMPHAVIKLGLSRHRFEVDAFVDSQSALQNIEPSVYDLLLLDVLMKGLDGLELYDKMRKIDEYIRVCFISASNTF